MIGGPEKRMFSALERLMADSSRATALADAAQQRFGLQQVQALMEADAEIKDAQEQKQAEAEAARASEAAKRAALGPFQMQLPQTGAAATRPVAFRNPMSQIPVDSMQQAAKNGLSASAAVQQRLRDAGVAPAGPGAAPEGGLPPALQGLSVAGPTLQQSQYTQRLQAQPNRFGAGYTMVPSQQSTVTETPNQLTVQDIVAARQQQAQAQAEAQAQRAQLQAQQEQAVRAHVRAMQLELLKQRGRTTEGEAGGKRAQALAELQNRLDMKRDAAKLAAEARIKEELAKREGPPLSPTAEKQLADFSNAEQTAQRSQLAAMTALRMLDDYGKDTYFGTGLHAAVKGMFGAAAPEAQALDTAFKEVNMQKVMEFAQAAGARSIDSDAERAAMEKTVPTLSKDDPVNRRILLFAASQSARAEYLSRARQEHISARGNLGGFDPKAIDNQIQTAFNPQTYDVVVLQKSDQIPEGWVPIQSLLQPEAGKRTAGAPKARAAAPAPKRVLVQTPDGRVGTIDAKDVRSLVNARGKVLKELP